ncbi:hypothetical protein ILUMI_17504 [Ignelater luminosus]|uniref:Uncharacterized protein n=1 Tax=Ignelater luminosus TaxID=2038154 RepID=A0A8K0CS58_IGNLU|nr:hypothetical protein ILUMI_17504 [Ignelater luminosus]
MNRRVEIGSDHCLVQMGLITTEKNKEPSKRGIVKKQIKTYKLKDSIARESYYKELNRAEWRKRDTDIKGRWKNLKEKIKEAAERTCGTTKIENRRIKGKLRRRTKHGIST